MAEDDDLPARITDDALPALLEHWRRRRGRTFEVAVTETITATDSASAQVIRPTGIPSEEAVGAPTVQPLPSLLIQAVVTVGEKTDEGHLIEGIAVPWFEIIDALGRDPGFLYQIHWRKLEEVIAGAYKREGWPEVILTPRSGDKGRDVIATKPGIGSIRIIDQVKAYAPGLGVVP